MILCGDVCDVVCDVDCDIMCDVVFDGVNGSEGGKVKWFILSCWWVLVTDDWMDIGGCRVTFSTEKESLQSSILQ